ncbi:mucin-associated surface protein [Arthrobacter sp. LjRoot14]|uniref:mucin-associated surface protein n=1 Tax=Arthrobacter sp. LjRoot14 TaxID=3342265 RepID=UPI003ED03B57
MTLLAVSRRRARPAQRWHLVLAAGVLSAALAGCSSAAPDLDVEAAQQLQAKVLTVSQSAAGNDPAGALKTLDELVAQLDAAAAEGDVSFKRHQSIMKAIEAVRADLSTAKAQAEAAAAAAAQAAAAKAAADAAAAEAAKAAAVPAAEAPAPVAPAPAQQNQGPGKGEKGKGKDG